MAAKDNDWFGPSGEESTTGWTGGNVHAGPLYKLEIHISTKDIVPMLSTYDTCRLEEPDLPGDCREGIKIGPGLDCEKGVRGGVLGGFGVTGGVGSIFESGCFPRVCPAGGIPNGVEFAGEVDGNARVGKAIGLMAGAGATFHGELVVRVDSGATLSDRSAVSPGCNHCILRLSR